MSTLPTRSWSASTSAEARHPKLHPPVPDPPRDYLGRLVVRRRGSFLFLPVAEVDWIEAADNYVRIHACGSEYLIRDTISGLVSRLDPRRFVRIHRSVVVAIDRIREMQPLFHGEFLVTLTDGTRLRSGRSYTRVMRELVSNA